MSVNFGKCSQRPIRWGEMRLHMCKVTKNIAVLMFFCKFGVPPCGLWKDCQPSGGVLIFNILPITNCWSYSDWDVWVQGDSKEVWWCGVWWSWIRASTVVRFDWYPGVPQKTVPFPNRPLPEGKHHWSWPTLYIGFVYTKSQMNRPMKNIHLSLAHRQYWPFFFFFQWLK